MSGRDTAMPLRIGRLQVEEGFLDGLDLPFSEGLNVLVGPRGVGKTSIIEIVRYCLDVPALTERFAKEARDHARSILGDGRVIVTCSLGAERFLLTRRAGDN